MTSIESLKTCEQHEVQTHYDRDLLHRYAKGINDSSGLILPTIATVLPQARVQLQQSGIDYDFLIHAEQCLNLHRPLSPEANLLSSSEIIEIVDQGPKRHVLITTRTEIRDGDTNEALCTLSDLLVARGEGGFSAGKLPRKSALARAGHAIPDRAPDLSVPCHTQDNQALLYAECGDRNPIHSDTEIARKAGFTRPILHGLCTYGIACSALTATALDHNPGRIRSFDARFASPVYPGETLITDIWHGEKGLHFRVRIESREEFALNHGFCSLD